MASDAHAHPFDLYKQDASSETLRRELGVACAASAWHEEEFLFNEKLATEAELSRPAGVGACPIVLCFGVHPQLPTEAGDGTADASLAFLGRLVREGRIRAIGEAGFDLFDGRFRATEPSQETYFRAQLELARSSSLPLVLHIRRAMHKVFAYGRELRTLPAVILHSYSGTLREANDLLKRGVNAYFSFGTTIGLNHKRAMEACASLASDHLLFETDAPYQPPRGKERSTWSDLFDVIATAARLRAEAGSDARDERELQEISDRNFRRAYGLR
jgi:TatD DNase family protein